MAGRPKLRTLKLRIQETGGFERVVDRIGEGVTLRALAEEYDTSVSQLAHLLNSPEWKEKFQEAKRLAVNVEVESAFAGLKTAMPENANIKKNQFDAAFKLATVFDRERFGENKAGVQVHLSIGDLHLQALKQVRQGVTIDAQVTTPAIESDDLNDE